MHRISRRNASTASLAALLIAVWAAPAWGQDSAGREIPAAFAPFEYLVGSWKGQGVPRDDPSQRFRGWPETHAWAWSFAGGKPVAMSAEFKGSKLFKSASLTFDAAAKRYRLKAVPATADAEAMVYEGGLDASRKLLTLDRTALKPSEPAERITLRANSNFIRYTLVAERKPPNRVQFAPVIEVGLTKEGETFAAGARTAERRKCVVTGGAATQTVAYQGREFPICCSGCRDEFLESPAKYLKKAALAAAAQDEDDAREKSSKPAPSRVKGADDPFADDVAAPAAEPSKPKMKPKSKDEDVPSAPDSKAKDAERASRLLQVARNLEKAGKPAAALKSYREIVETYADAPAAKAAKERIKALEAR